MNISNRSDCQHIRCAEVDQLPSSNLAVNLWLVKRPPQYLLVFMCNSTVQCGIMCMWLQALQRMCYIIQSNKITNTVVNIDTA